MDDSTLVGSGVNRQGLHNAEGDPLDDPLDLTRSRVDAN